MCTAVRYCSGDHYFGRNLDLDRSFHEAVTLTPRRYPLRFRYLPEQREHYAMIGIAAVSEYPLYYEATNERGLSIAGLNFPGNAAYLDYCDGYINLAPFELIPWLLGRFKSIHEAREALSQVRIVNTPFAPGYPLTPLHWMVSDKTGSLVLEPMEDGLRIYENPVGVLTNSPPFDYHLYNLNNYLNLTPKEPLNRFSNKISLLPYSFGMGAIGLPGDLSSASRFVRAAFVLNNSVSDDTESSRISQFFHVLESVAQPRGCNRIGDGHEITMYASCCNIDRGIYYYKTYENSQITGIKLFSENLDGNVLKTYPLTTEQQIKFEN